VTWAADEGRGAEMSAVPRIWISTRTGKCAWPPQNSKAQQYNTFSKCMIPEDDWDYFDYKEFHGNYS